MKPKQSPRSTGPIMSETLRQLLDVGRRLFRAPVFTFLAALVLALSPARLGAQSQEEIPAPPTATERSRDLAPDRDASLTREGLLERLGVGRWHGLGHRGRGT